MSEEREPQKPATGSTKLAAALVVVGLLALFCILNRNRVYVAPFGQAPLYLVILGSAAAGALLSSIIRLVRGRKPTTDRDDTR